MRFFKKEEMAVFALYKYSKDGKKAMYFPRWAVEALITLQREIMLWPRQESAVLRGKAKSPRLSGSKGEVPWIKPSLGSAPSAKV